MFHKGKRESYKRQEEIKLDERRLAQVKENIELEHELRAELSVTLLLFKPVEPFFIRIRCSATAAAA